jgi:hypothetical protein
MKNFFYDGTKGDKEWVTKLEAKDLRLNIFVGVSRQGGP